MTILGNLSEDCCDLSGDFRMFFGQYQMKTAPVHWHPSVVFLSTTLTEFQSYRQPGVNSHKNRHEIACSSKYTRDLKSRYLKHNRTKDRMCEKAFSNVKKLHPPRGNLPP